MTASKCFKNKKDSTKYLVANYAYSLFRSRGVWQNLVDLMGWRLLGLCRPAQIDWTSIYHVDDLPQSRTYKDYQMV